MKRRNRTTALEEIVIRSWWAFLYTLICYAIYEQASHYTDNRITSMQNEIDHLMTQKATALQLQQDLRDQLSAQNDPAWIEQSLLRVLGMAPKGSIKVIFPEEEM